ncbi:MAG TPA: Sec-independent protein translocase protein TatB, partial [Candidatus Limnocylindrales bacterium]|nr:Sec-independent protein translocase protein TatB [Candidatus Limnocylindrales bacterium]
MPDIGFGEIVAIVVIALLVFGPDRLPKVAADAARMLRQVRQMAASARKDLVDAVGVDDDGEMAQTVRELRDLDPRRAMNGVLSDEPTPGVRRPGARPPSGPAGAERSPGAVGQKPTEPAPGAVGPATTEPAPGAVGPKPTGAVPGGAAAPVAPPVVAPAPVDPDWTCHTCPRRGGSSRR